MNQPHALEHYHHLSKTFQFDVYLPRSQILAYKSSNTWDLLVNPVQRLLHYPQLLAAIVAETSDSHGDKANLVAAHSWMEQLARHLNARWRQQKVVQDVLASAGLVDAPQLGTKAAKATKKKGGFKTKEGSEANAEAGAVKAMGERLKSYEVFMAQFSRETVDWADAMRNLVGALEEWTQSFGRVIWMDAGEERSGAFDVFLLLICDQLLAVGDELKAEIREGILRTIDSLKATMVAPVRLLDAMHALEPLHHSPLNVNVEMSESYVVLRAQLVAELPAYLSLLDKSMAMCALKFAHIQGRFSSEIHDQWEDLSGRLSLPQTTVALAWFPKAQKHTSHNGIRNKTLTGK